MNDEFTPGCSVVYSKRRLHEATFVGLSKSGKSVIVRHNALAPWGVGMVHTAFNPKNIRKWTYG